MIITKNKKKYRKINAIKGLYWKVAKTHCVLDFDDAMQKIYDVNRGTIGYLTNIRYHK